MTLPFAYIEKQRSTNLLQETIDAQINNRTFFQTSDKYVITKRLTRHFPSIHTSKISGWSVHRVPSATEP